MASRVITFDVETALNPKEQPNGWGSCRDGTAGISTVCMWDSALNAPFTYLCMRYENGGLIRDEQAIQAMFAHLQSADWLLTFNGATFDIPAIEGFVGEELTCYHEDLLLAVWKALRGKRQKGYGLDALSERTLGLGKLEQVMPPWQLLREHRYSDLINYCMVDVMRTRQLSNHILEHGWIIDINGEELPVEGLGISA